MIIEDDAKIRAELAKLLNKHGYQTSAYETYYEDILRNKPDLIRVRTLYSYYICN